MEWVGLISLLSQVSKFYFEFPNFHYSYHLISLSHYKLVQYARYPGNQQTAPSEIYH